MQNVNYELYEKNDYENQSNLGENYTSEENEMYYGYTNWYGKFLSPICVWMEGGDCTQLFSTSYFTIKRGV